MRAHFFPRVAPPSKIKLNKRFKTLRWRLPLSVVCFGRYETTPNLKAGKAVPVFWPPFPLYARDFFPVVRRFFCRLPTEQVLYYRNLGLYYGLASMTLPLYAKPRAKVKGGCLSCNCCNVHRFPDSLPWKMQACLSTLCSVFVVAVAIVRWYPLWKQLKQHKGKSCQQHADCSRS